jgi:hypothetical protein
VSQYLRLCRRALSLAGVELVSVTPDSRLNDYVRYVAAADAVAEIEANVGKAEDEPTRGLYTQMQSRQPHGLGPMRDLKPHHWKAKGQPGDDDKPPAARSSTQVRPRASTARRVIAAIDHVPATPVHINEEG